MKAIVLVRCVNKTCSVLGPPPSPCQYTSTSCLSSTTGIHQLLLDLQLETPVHGHQSSIVPVILVFEDKKPKVILFPEFGPRDFFNCGVKNKIMILWLEHFEVKFFKLCPSFADHRVKGKLFDINNHWVFQKTWKLAKNKMFNSIYKYPK